MNQPKQSMNIPYWPTNENLCNSTKMTRTYSNELSDTLLALSSGIIVLARWFEKVEYGFHFNI